MGCLPPPGGVFGRIVRLSEPAPHCQSTAALLEIRAPPPIVPSEHSQWAKRSLAIYPSLAGKTVFVSGGASGIGEAIVRAFAGKAPRSVSSISCRRRARRLPRNSARAAPRFALQPADVIDISALKAAIAAVRAEFGVITVLVNNAANDMRHGWQEETPESFDARLAVNLKHQFFAIQRVAPDMIAAGGGSIINFGSISWRIGDGRDSGLHRLESRDRRSDTVLRARPRRAPHSRQLRAPGLGDDGAAARRSGSTRTPTARSRSGSACRTGFSRTTSPAWCSSSPQTTAPCARRRISWSTAAGSREIVGERHVPLRRRVGFPWRQTGGGLRRACPRRAFWPKWWKGVVSRPKQQPFEPGKPPHVQAPSSAPRRADFCPYRHGTTHWTHAARRSGA